MSEWDRRFAAGPCGLQIYSGHMRVFSYIRPYVKTEHRIRERESDAEFHRL